MYDKEVIVWKIGKNETRERFPYYLPIDWTRYGIKIKK